MIFSDHLLTVITFLPTLGALLLLFVGGRDEAGTNLSRWIALVVTLVTAALSLYLWYLFDPSNTGFQTRPASIVFQTPPLTCPK